MTPLEFADPAGAGGRLVLRAAPDDADADPVPSRPFAIDVEAEEPRRRDTPWLMLASGAMATLWAGGAGAFLLGYFQSGAFAESTTPMLAGLGAVAVAPVILFLLLGAMGETLRRASREARALAAAAHRLSRPGPEAERAARTVTTAVRREVDALDAAITATLNRLASIEGGVTQRAEALTGAGESARDSAAAVARALQDSIEKLVAAADALAAQSATTVEAHEQRAVALLGSAQAADAAAREAADLFGAQASNALATSVQVADATAAHASAIAEASARLDAVAANAAANARLLEEAVTRADAALGGAVARFADTRTALDTTLDRTGTAADSLREAASQAADEASRFVGAGKAAREELIGETEQRVTQVRANLAEQATSLVATLRGEVEAARQTAEQSLAALQQTAAMARAAAEAASEAALAEATTAEQRLQTLGETAFEAGVRADKVTEARLAEARALVEQSVSLLSVAGDRITERFAATVAACTAQTETIQTVLANLQATTDTLPTRAAEQARAIEAALETSLARLNEAGRGALEEAAQVDEAFQARLRESYAALGDIVARLGGFAGMAGAAPPPPVRAREPATEPVALRPRQIAPAPAPEPAPVPAPQPEAMAPIPADPTPEPAPEPAATPTPEPEMSPDDLFETEFRKAGGFANSEREGWRWKDILASLDGGRKKATDEATPVADNADDDTVLLRAELVSLGLGSTGIMNDTALVRIGTAAAKGDDARRRAVRQFANDALHRMNSRLLDPRIRESAERYVAAHADAAARDALSEEMTALYFVVDAALAS